MSEPADREAREALLATVRAAVDAGRLDEAVQTLASLRPPDAVDIVEELDLEVQGLLLARMADPQAADILEEMEDEAAAEVAAELGTAELAAILDHMETEEAADVLGDLTAAEAENVLLAMDDLAEAEVRSLLIYPDDTAGGRMSREFLSVRADRSVAQAMEEYRNQARELRGAYYLYTVDPEGRLMGVISLRQLLLADPDTRLQDIKETDVVRVRTTDDQETAAQLVARYDLMALPVVDAADRLVGVIQHEDLVDVLVEEATEDMLRLAGVSVAETAQAAVAVSVRRRLPWLTLNLGMQLVVVRTLMLFDATISHVAVLAALFPIVTGQGGNVGSQTMTVVVRALALNALDRGHGMRLLARELAVGLICGLVVGALAGIIAMYAATGEEARLVATAIWLAMALNLGAGALAGAGVPLLFDRLGLDPALASAMFITAVTDTLGVLFFLGLFELLI